MCFFQHCAYFRCCIEGLFQYGLHIIDDRDRLLHIHFVQITPAVSCTHFYKPLPQQKFPDRFVKFLLKGMIYSISKVSCYRLRQYFCQYMLQKVSHIGFCASVKATDDKHPSRSLLAQICRDIDILKLPVEITCLDLVDRCQSLDLPGTVTDNGSLNIAAIHISAKFLQGFRSEVHVAAQLLQHGAFPVLQRFNDDVFSFQHILVLWFPQVQAVVIDIVLRHRIDQIGNIAIPVDIFTDPGRADIFQIYRQRQLLDLSRHPCIILLKFLAILVSGFQRFSSEYQMIHTVYGIFRRLRTVGGCIGDHITSDYHVEFPSRENFPQPF